MWAETYLEARLSEPFSALVLTWDQSAFKLRKKATTKKIHQPIFLGKEVL